jgi:hypothetical protein
LANATDPSLLHDVGSPPSGTAGWGLTENPAAMAFGAAFVVAALACVATCYCSSRRPKAPYSPFDDPSTHVL